MRPIVGMAFALVTSFFAAPPISAQEAPQEEAKVEYVTTAEVETLIHDDLKAVPGTEARIMNVEFPPGWTGDRHYHTGDVFVYVLEGEFVVDVEGEGRLTFGPGEVYHEEIEAVMQARNPSTTMRTKAILFQVGEKGQPLMMQVE